MLFRKVVVLFAKNSNIKSKKFQMEHQLRSHTKKYNILAPLEVIIMQPFINKYLQKFSFPYFCAIVCAIYFAEEKSLNSHLPKISSISEPPLGKDFDLRFFSVHFRISSSVGGPCCRTGFLFKWVTCCLGGCTAIYRKKENVCTG